MTQPLVSCIIPVYNGERYLKETLQSVLDQDYPNLETIVVDDGSTDRTRQVVEQFGRGVKYFWQDNAGVGAARNLGIAQAGGDMIAFIDADDLWHPEKISRQVELLKASPQAVACFTLIRNFIEPEANEKMKALAAGGKVVLAHPYLPSSFLATREVFEQVGLFAEIRRQEDVDYFSRMLEMGIVSDIVSKVLVYRRLHRHNLSGDALVRTRSEMMEMAKTALEVRRGNQSPAVENTAPGLFSRSYSAFLSAEEKSPDACSRFYSIAGHAVCIRFAGSGLAGQMAPALAHLRADSSTDPELTICAWDRASSGGLTPDIPWPGEYATARRELPGFDDDHHIRAVYYKRNQMLHALNAKEQLALFCVPDFRDLPQANQGAPFVMIFRWWLRAFGLQLLHAAAVGTSDNGMLLVGPGGSGKSTVALSSLAAELLYVSDDYCFIETQFPYRAYSIYSSAKVHEHAISKFPHLALVPHRIDLEDSGKRLLFLHEFYPEKIARALPVKGIAVPVISDAEDSALESASVGASLKALIPSTLFQIPGSRQKDFDEISNLVKKIPSYTLHVGTDPETIGKALTRHLCNRKPLMGL